MPDPRKIIDIVRKAGVGLDAKPKTRWDQIKKAAYITSTVYGVLTPVRRADGSIDVDATAIKYANIARGRVGMNAYPLPEYLSERAGIQEVGGGGGDMVTTIPPQWYADP